VDFIPVETAEDMFRIVQGQIARMDIAVFAAAVADFTPEAVSRQKIKKVTDRLTIELVRTKDILGSARSEFGFKGFLVGFAAETESLLENARHKLESKGCDLVVANDVSEAGLGFDSDLNEVVLVTPDGFEPLDAADKVLIADQIAEVVLRLCLTRP
jgi:phosphopantothenoylcysteine synthetase/decarboxylase